jgi:glycosyltransferase involved in cell wall biosynthesis
LKVLHINSYDHKGGAETVFQINRKIPATENLSGFVNYGHSGETSDINFTSWENDNKLFGTINYIFSFHNYSVLNSFLRSNKVDIIHLHGFFASLSPSILFAIKKNKVKQKYKVIQTLHDFHLICPNAGLYNYSKNDICERCIGNRVKLSIFAMNCDKRGWVHSFIKGIRSLLANNLFKQREIVDKFICPSEFMKSKLLDDGIESNKITVIRNPIFVNETETTSVKKNIICYFGRFSKEKNLQFLITTFSLWKEKSKNDFQLYLIGEGKEENNFRRIASGSSSEKEIFFMEFMPHDRLAGILKEVKYLSLTSNCYENAPMTIIEALSLNILPIAPNIGGMSEGIKSVVKCGRTYNSGDIESWIESINFLENNYDEQMRILIESKKKISEELSTINFYNSILALYKS